MAKTREQKKEIVASIAEKFRGMKAASFSSVSGFTMEDANTLRQKASESNVSVFVAKKTLLQIAAKEAGIEIDPKNFTGSILTAVSYGDEVAAAKLVSEFGKSREDVLTLVAGILEGKAISASEVVALAKLPSKQQLLGQLVGSINAPISGFVQVLAGNMRGLLTVLNAVKEQKA